MAMPDLILPIFPYDARRDELDEEIAASPPESPFGGDAAIWFGPQARWLLAAVLSSLDLCRSDEIAILTTSDDTYVTICVSVTAFNFCRISRVVGPDTRVVVVIHEFGYAFPNIAGRCAAWREQGITVIEDCVHLLGMMIDGTRVGDFGDYALFSLPKIIPVPSGGILRTRRPFSLPSLDTDQTARTEAGRQAAERYLPHHRWFSDRRAARHEILRNGVGVERIIQPSTPAIPWLTYVAHRTGATARCEGATEGVELGATLRTDCLLIPTNPMVAEETFHRLATTL